MTTGTQNSLARASSSYLRSAMHQPIQWHEFGEEAFAAARAANKPVLLDIGAVWCHWCHVMDRESYDDPEVAAIVNDHYIAVKVDRDERPDIDSRYQLAVASLTGQGGWPLTAFLTPDGKPFYGGTYFPPADAYGRPSFKRVLLSIAAAYRDKHGDVMEQAQMVESAIARAESFSSGGEVSATVIDAILESARKMFDPVNGGFGGAPKFPHPAALDLVMEEYVRTKERGSGAQPLLDGAKPRHHTDGEDLQTIFVHTLEKMARGGVYDQLAGGFHRYSVDESWIVPHFEKMCYDNSELLKNYVHAYQATGDEFFAGVARDIIRWMDEWLSDRAHGGFYASQDADYSMDDDGDYFTWTLAETKAALNADEFAVATLYYDIQEVGDMHHDPAKNVLRIGASVGEIAGRLKIPEERVGALLAAAKTKMYAARLLRPTPYVDKTVYSGWNAMCVSAYLEAAKVLDLAEARHFALRSLDRLLSEGWNLGAKSTAAGEGPFDSRSGQVRSTLKHVIAYSDPKAERREVSGVLDDYAFSVIACLDAYEATADLSYFRFARSIAEAMVAGFFDPVGGGFFDTRVATEEKPALGILGTRRKPYQDSPTPAGNSAAAIALLRLDGYALDASASSKSNPASFSDRAEQTLEVYAGVAGQHGIFAATYGLAVVRFLQPPMQVVVVGKDDGATELYRTAARPLGLNTAVLRLDADKAAAQNLPPALAETIPNIPALHEGRSFAVVCSGFTCQPPIFDPAELARALGSA
ncbi:MAG: thioredoxin domain-containing protein [Terriglobales bacterium]|jgi:uncharacterized protein YyaL (SSP411 family)